MQQATAERAAEGEIVSLRRSAGNGLVPGVCIADVNR